MTDAEEETTGLGAEAPKRDGEVPELPTHPMGLRAMARRRCQDLQGGRGYSLTGEAYDAGYNDGYGSGYVDGVDAGRDEMLERVCKLLETLL